MLGPVGSNYGATKPSTIYKGRPLDVWFYGSRKDFFSTVVQDSDQEALKTIGTNAFLFLFLKRTGRKGMGSFIVEPYLTAEQKSAVPWSKPHDQGRSPTGAVMKGLLPDKPPILCFPLWGPAEKSMFRNRRLRTGEACSIEPTRRVCSCGVHPEE